MSRMELADALNRQMDGNRNLNLLHGGTVALYRIDPAFLAAVEELSCGTDGPVRGAPTDLIPIAVDLFIDRLYRKNQFLQVDRGKRERLEGIYAATWSAIRESGDIEGTLRSLHYPALMRWTADAYPESFRAPLASAREIGEIPCAEYSARLQGRLFRIGPEEWLEPVLDIGCGRSAFLVRHLRSMGLEAVGIDRVAEPGSPFLARADWFSYGYGKDRWGTVTANMSFSNHFRYAQRYEKDAVGRYAAVYGAILDSLKPGGVFLYAPGLPLLEEGLDVAEYGCSKWDAVDGYSVSRVRRSPRGAASRS